MKKHFLVLAGCLTLTVACNLPLSTPTVESPPTQTPLPPLEAEPTPQASATPKPPPLYFTEDFNVASPYWVFIQIGGAQPAATSFQNGALQIAASAPDTWLVGIHTVHTYSNVFVRAAVSLEPGGSAGLVCRYTEETGWYEFNAASDGTYGILLGQWLAPGVVKYIPMISDSNSLLSGRRGAELGFFCHDEMLELYVNNTLLRRYDATNYGLTEGNIGIAAASFAEAPMTAAFEWIKIEEK